MRRISSGLGVVLALCFVSEAGVDSATGSSVHRIEVPIKQTVISNGKIRYSIPISVGHSPEFDAMLDTGSAGLRLLHGAVSPSAYSVTNRTSDYHYGSGLKLTGVIADATLSIGGASTDKMIPIQVVQSIGCADSSPHCPASRISSDDFRIGGNGLPREGFRAIIGVSMGLSDAVNPLSQIGTRSWIIMLPRPGDDTLGKLVIDPDENERSGYTMLRGDEILRRLPGAGGWQDAIAGCLIRVDAHRRLCGPTLLDTGTQGIRITSHDDSDLSGWNAGAQMAIAFGSDRGPELTMPFSAGSDDPSSVASIAQGNQPRTRIMAGTLPYFAFSVLYDFKSGAIGLKPR
jgi:Protein of unknown function (DUF3443)